MINSTKSQSGIQYDPWLDTDESEEIDIKDVAAISKAYGSTGDPAKNVNVTNWPSAKSEHEVVIHETMNFSNSGYSWQGNIFCGRYSRLGIVMSPRDASVGTYTITFYLQWLR